MPPVHSWLVPVPTPILRSGIGRSQPSGHQQGPEKEFKVPTVVARYHQKLSAAHWHPRTQSTGPFITLLFDLLLSHSANPKSPAFPPTGSQPPPLRVEPAVFYSFRTSCEIPSRHSLDLYTLNCRLLFSSSYSVHRRRQHRHRTRPLFSNTTNRELLTCRHGSTSLSLADICLRYVRVNPRNFRARTCQRRNSLPNKQHPTLALSFPI